MAPPASIATVAMPSKGTAGPETSQPSAVGSGPRRPKVTGMSAPADTTSCAGSVAEIGYSGPIGISSAPAGAAPHNDTMATITTARKGRATRQVARSQSEGYVSAGGTAADPTGAPSLHREPSGATGSRDPVTNERRFPTVDSHG